MSPPPPLPRTGEGVGGRGHPDSGDGPDGATRRPTAASTLARLAEAGQAPVAYGALLDAAEEIVSHGDDTLEPDRVIALAGCAHLARFQARLLPPG